MSPIDTIKPVGVVTLANEMTNEYERMIIKIRAVRAILTTHRIGMLLEIYIIGINYINIGIRVCLLTIFCRKVTGLQLLACL